MTLRGYDEVPHNLKALFLCYLARISWTTNFFCSCTNKFPKLLETVTVIFVSVIASIVFMKHLREIPHIFVANLALFDLGVMSMDVFALIGAIRGDTFLPEFPVLCEISGIICMLSCFGSLWTMMFVAVNRLDTFFWQSLGIPLGFLAVWEVFTTRKKKFFFRRASKFKVVLGCISI